MSEKFNLEKRKNHFLENGELFWINKIQSWAKKNT